MQNPKTKQADESPSNSFVKLYLIPEKNENILIDTAKSHMEVYRKLKKTK